MVTYPIININGSSASSLRADYVSAINKLEDALNHVRQTAPHGRDYQTNPEVYLQARAEHEARCKALTDMIADFDKLAIYADSRVRK